MTKKNTPELVEVGAGEVVCPFCKTQIIPDYEDSTGEEEIGSCEHMEFMFIWKGDMWEYATEEIKTWWNDQVKADPDTNGYSLRTCPHIDVLYEHEFCSGPANWAVSVGFRGD